MCTITLRVQPPRRDDSNERTCASVVSCKKSSATNEQNNSTSTNANEKMLHEKRYQNEHQNWVHCIAKAIAPFYARRNRMKIFVCVFFRSAK